VCTTCSRGSYWLHALRRFLACQRNKIPGITPGIFSYIEIMSETFAIIPEKKPGINPDAYSFLGNVGLLSQPNILTIGFQPERAYDDYLQLEKSLISPQNVQVLYGLYESLKNQEVPRYLEVAGWAAAEIGLMDTSKRAVERKQRLDQAVDCWQRALQAQRSINAKYDNPIVEYSRPTRLALDIAIVPLLRGVVDGDVTERTCKNVFERCLEIAKYNRMQRDNAYAAGEMGAMQDYDGLGHELNFILAMNRRFSSSRFVIPSSARSDAGQYRMQQTHDLVAIHQQWGVIRSAIPIEIKGRTSNGDRKRYRALLVRARTHLSLNSATPGAVLEAIDAAYHNPEDKPSVVMADAITKQTVDMVRDYYAGELLDITDRSSVQSFHSNSKVFLRHYPETQASA
jgi:hypothetical protein